MPRASRSVLPVVGIVLAVVGVALLVLEVVRVVSGNTLGTVGGVLLWVGVGLVAIGMLMLAWTLLGLPSSSSTSYAAAPADFDDDAEPVAPPRKTAAPSTPPAPQATGPQATAPPATQPTAAQPAAPTSEDVDLGGEG